MKLFRDLSAIILVGCAVIPVVGSCASTSVSNRNLTIQSEATWELTPTDLSTRRLFRVSVSGEEGHGSLRIVMVLNDPATYSLSASDTFGRAIWDLVIQTEDSFLVDHKTSRICSVSTLMALPGDALESFSLETLPRLLLGRLPVPPSGEAPIQGHEVDFVDQEGRRWTAKLDNSLISTWTLWSDNEPLIWWTRQPKGGILSHRRGAQFRWKEVVSEPLRSSDSQVEIPTSYQWIECEESDLPEFHQDQSPSSNPGNS